MNLFVAACLSHFNQITRGWLSKNWNRLAADCGSLTGYWKLRNFFEGIKINFLPDIPHTAWPM